MASVVACGIAGATLGQAISNDKIFSSTGLVAIIIAIIAAGLSVPLCLLVAVIRLCQVSGAKLTNKVDTTIRKLVSIILWWTDYDNDNLHYIHLH